MTKIWSVNEIVKFENYSQLNVNYPLEYCIEKFTLIEANYLYEIGSARDESMYKYGLCNVFS